MEQPLQFTTTNITQFIFPLYGVTLLYCIGNYLKKISEISRIVNLIVWMGILVGMNHIIYGTFNYIGAGFIIQDYMSYLIGKAGFSTPVSGGLVSFMRPYTLLGEPSDTAVFYVVCTSLLAGSILLKDSKRKVIPNDIYKILFFIVLVFLNGSTSGYLGLGIIVITVLVFALYRNIFTSYGFGVGRVALLLTLVPLGYILFFGGVIENVYTLEYHLRKVSPVERTARVEALVHTWENVFMASPIFGAGYGSHLSPVFLAYLIGNTGILGFIFFYMIVGSVIYQIHRYSTIITDKSSRVIAVSSLFAVIVFFATTAGGASGGVLGWGITWLLLGLGASFSDIDAGLIKQRMHSHQRVVESA